MPLWYPTGAVKEHLAVIQHAGLFDIGHMAGIMVSGPDALEALQWAFTKDLSLSGARAAYGAFLDASGGVVDDAIVYPLSGGRYFVVLNVGKGERIAEKLRAWIAANGKNADVRDLAGTYAKLDLPRDDQAAQGSRRRIREDALFLLQGRHRAGQERHPPCRRHPDFPVPYRVHRRAGL